MKDAALRTLIYLCAFCTVAVLAAILGHILWNGLPHISWEFLSSTYSASRTGSKGILPMIINTIYVVAITLLIAVPIGVCCAVYLTQYAKKGRLVKAIRFATEVLLRASHPSFSACLVTQFFASAFSCNTASWRDA